MDRTLKSFLVIVIVCWCCMSATPAGAMIVFDNGTPSKSGGFLSDNDGGVRFADDFVFGAPEVFNGIRFWGFYSPTDTPPLTISLRRCSMEMLRDFLMGEMFWRRA